MYSPREKRNPKKNKFDYDTVNMLDHYENEHMNYDGINFAELMGNNAKINYCWMTKNFKNKCGEKTGYVSLQAWEKGAKLPWPKKEYKQHLENIRKIDDLHKLEHQRIEKRTKQAESETVNFNTMTNATFKEYSGNCMLTSK